VRIRLTADRTSLRANGQDLSFVTVEVVDGGGRAHPNAGREVTFSITGPGVIAAVGNRDMTSEEPYQGSRRRLFHGMALVVVRSSGKAGAPGLKSSVLQLASR